MKRRETILNRLAKVSALPTAAMEVFTLANSADASMSEIVRKISHDPGLTATILRLANSAMFGGARQTGSVQDAALRLGTRQLGNLALAAALDPLSRVPIRGYGMAPGELLTRALATAIGVEEVARELHAVLAPHAFTAAMLCDVGKLVLGTFVEIDSAPIHEHAFEKGLSFDAAEREVLGIDHAEVGALLLTQWGLPECLSEVVLWHHRPDECPNPSETLQLVHLAAQLTLMAGIGCTEDGLNYRSSNKIVSQKHLKQREVERVVYHTAQRLELLRA